jgi:hypothetical protein
MGKMQSCQAISEQLIDKNGFPSSSLIFLLDLMALPHDYSLSSIVRSTQRHWLQPTKERWHFQPREEYRLAYLFPFLQKLGCIEGIVAKEKEYDYALLLGGYYTRLNARFAHLAKECEKGVCFKQLVLLTGERFLDPVTELPLFPLNKGATETDLMLHILKSYPLLEKIPLTLINTPGSSHPKGWQRPTTKDTLIQWLKSNPIPGKCLFISNQPFIPYQQSVIQSTLPKEFSFETVGSYAEPGLALCVYLDNLARWLYQLSIGTNPTIQKS